MCDMNLDVATFESGVGCQLNSLVVFQIPST